MKELFETITQWQDDVFTSATSLSCVNHLQEEVQELKSDILNKAVNPSEIADCFMLLFGVCNHLGMDYNQICKALEEKHQINLKRKWGKVNELGYVKHIEE